ncbi:ACP phosphodiesterase [Vibrio sp. SCSIO 43136]|uniref:acyl carrier protein phosphodiesterase n=1 Tax=Vibrio sp. SCSIO 43136 TaxID=2819101 RepID=UPI002075BA18|nr:ACP phosphodiesterase [Vibrio sp. SCSIO 43136]USD66968.1 DUF479 domain-containing protein [Vibrio sp. SCSIO 43136]
MNFLAHLHIAEHSNSSLLGNLLGDFVKGDPDKQYPATISQGIRLHRFVDSYTDTHPIVKQAKLCFPSELRRFAPIALDMFWDHCLASDWQRYHQGTLSDFCDYAYEQTRTELTLPARYTQVSDAMWQGRWLESYAHFDNMSYALSRMAMRSPRMGALANTSHYLHSHYHHLTELFTALYPEILAAAKAQNERLK